MCAECKHGAVCSQQQLESTKSDYQMGSSQKMCPRCASWGCGSVQSAGKPYRFRSKSRKFVKANLRLSKMYRITFTLKPWTVYCWTLEKVQGTFQVCFFSVCWGFFVLFFSNFSLERQCWPKKILVWSIMPILTFMERLRPWLLGVYRIDGYTNAF